MARFFKKSMPLRVLWVFVVIYAELSVSNYNQNITNMNLNIHRNSTSLDAFLHSEDSGHIDFTDYLIEQGKKSKI